MWRVAEELISVTGIHLSKLTEASELTHYKFLGVTSEMVILSVVWIQEFIYSPGVKSGI
jgi:hypothetical protein